MEIIMILINGIELADGRDYDSGIHNYPSGEQNCLIKAYNPKDEEDLYDALSGLSGDVEVSLHYRDDSELFKYMAIVTHLARHTPLKVTCKIPYFPHSRMDRIHNLVRDIRPMDMLADFFERLPEVAVITRDFHSKEYMSNIFLNKNISFYNKQPTQNLIRQIALTAHEYPDLRSGEIIYSIGLKKDKIFFLVTDESAAKRYAYLMEIFDICPPVIWFTKDPDKTMCLSGNYQSDDLDGKTGIILGDICSKGDSFEEAIQGVHKALGHENTLFNMFVTHLDEEIYEGELYSNRNVCKIFTTDSIHWVKRNLDEGHLSESSRITVLPASDYFAIPSDNISF